MMLAAVVVVGSDADQGGDRLVVDQAQLGQPGDQAGGAARSQSGNAFDDDGALGKALGLIDLAGDGLVEPLDLLLEQSGNRLIGLGNPRRRDARSRSRAAKPSLSGEPAR